MKELLEKFFNLFGEGVAKMQESKTEEAIKKFKEASDLTSDIQKKAWESEEQLKKFFDSDEWKETLKKYVDMYLSANDVSSFVAQVKELAWNTDTLTKKVEELEKEKKSDDEVLSKTLDEAIDRLETVEKTVSNVRISKID